MAPTSSELLTERMHLMLARSMKDDLERVRVKLGARGVSDIVRRACAALIAAELGDSDAPAPDRYAGRTRLLVDTTAEPDIDTIAAAPREKRVAAPRDPARIRPGSSKFDPLPTDDISGHIAAMNEHITELAAAAQPISVVQVFDNALSGLGFDPDRIAAYAKAPGEVCLECFCLDPHHASTCSLAASDSASA